MRIDALSILDLVTPGIIMLAKENGCYMYYEGFIPRIKHKHKGIPINIDIVRACMETNTYSILKFYIIWLCKKAKRSRKKYAM